MTDESEPDRPPGDPERATAPSPPNETDESIYGHTDTVFTEPRLNRGVPRDPLPLRVLAAVEVGVSAVLFALIFFGVMYQVLGRYLPAISWVGAGELALTAMIAMTFMMTGYLVGRNGHIVIEVFDQMLKGSKLFVVLRVFSALVMAITCLALAYEAFVKAGAEWDRTSAAMHLPVGLLYVFAIFGFSSGAIHSLWKIPYANRPERQLDISEMEG